MKLQTSILVVFLAYTYCLDSVKIGIIGAVDSTGDESELVSIDLKRKDGKEDIKLIAQMRIHLVEGKVHLNGNMLKHGVVIRIEMRLTIIEFENGIQKAGKLKAVQLRVLVLETTAANGNKVLMVEEEFMQVEDYEVLQVDVKQVIFESMVRKPVTVISLSESKIHAKPKKQDHHVSFKDHPQNGVQQADQIMSWQAKYLLSLAFGFLTMLAIALLYVRYTERKLQRQNWPVLRPIDDTVTVDMEEEKKEKTDENLEFHFEFENAVVVDNKKALVE